MHAHTNEQSTRAGQNPPDATKKRQREGKADDQAHSRAQNGRQKETGTTVLVWGGEEARERDETEPERGSRKENRDSKRWMKEKIHL